MKKILLTMAFVLTGLGSAWADDVTVSNIEIPQGNSATLEVSLVNSKEYRQLFEFVLELPEGVTLVPNSQKLSSRFNSNAQLAYNEIATRKYKFICQAGVDVNSIGGKSGDAIMTVQLLADASLAVNTVLTGNLTGIEVTDQNVEKLNPDDKEFNISIVEPLEVKELNETSTSNIVASDKAVDVIVYRSIKANLWSTICLPFDMTEAQVNAAFGDGVELADLTSWSITGTLPEVDNINLVFSSVKSITKHHPYLIKIKGSTDITSFTVNNVTIYANNSPAYEVPFNYSDGNCKCAMNGTYKARKVPKDNFFMNNETFWRAQSNTTSIKGFRAYFKFTCNIEEYDEDEEDYVMKTYTITINDTNDSRISFSFTDDATKIKDIDANEDDDRIFNLSGQQVDNPVKKGLYITNGKKVVIK